jgi:rhodanese-related sulfurtransferase
MAEAQEIDPARAKELIDGGTPAVDVREDYEYEAGHIEGARHVPFERLSAATAGVESGGAVVFYCRTGDRSSTAAAAFAEAGIDAHNIAGGLEAWASEGLPLEPENGEVVERSGLPPA